MKKEYFSPRAKLLDTQFEEDLLINSVNGVESMNPQTGSWDEDDD